VGGGASKAVRRSVTFLLFLGLALAGFRTRRGDPFPSPQLKPAGGASAPVDFQKDVQPIFENSCYVCHGPNTQTSGFRLDMKQAALAGGKNGKAIIPGKAMESPLYARVAGLGGVSRMPMGGQPLDPDLVEKIRQWIDQGANWPDSAATASVEVKKYWAFVAPKLPSVPKVSHLAAPRNAIDNFVLARLETEKLSPSPQADRVTLLRRLSLDLIGLPPTPEDVDAFVADKSPRAYEKQVDRLLNSPHYGERWARVWLDAAGYADSDGFEKDKQRRVWFYRDWVINALNRDLPYNQFIIEQIAGDLLPHPTQDQVVATGFLRNSMINEEGGIDPEQFRMEAMFERMDAIGKAMLGLTINCAQCHDHKFDPLKQEEYYRMFAFLNDSNEANMAVYTPAEQMKRTEILRRTREIEGDLQRRNPGWQEQMSRWEQQVSTGQPEWTVIRPAVDDISTGGQKYYPQDDGSFLTQGYAPTKSKVKLTVKTDVQNITAFRLELMNDPNLPMNGPGRSLKGGCALTEFEAEAAAAGAPDKVTKVKFAKATADVDQPEMVLEPVFDDKSGKRRVTGPVDYAIDGKDETAWGIDAGPGMRNQPRKAVFVAASPISNPGGTILTIYLTENHGGWNSDDNQSNNIGRFRLSLTTAAGATADPVPQRIRDILSIPPDKRTPEQIQTVFGYWRTTVPEWQAENREIAEIWNGHPEGSAQLVLNERNRPRETHVLSRGDFLKPAKLVNPGVPAFLHPLPQDSSWKNGQPTRLTFAEWLASRNSPTTARSMVNRVWQAYFGIGLVATSENFGTQAEPPSHPELLDWLAVEFMDNGWSLKKLHKLIVMSATYQQSSRVTPELYERDPYNRLLARGPRFRVDGEVVRDIELSASGLLNPRVGGPSAFPPAPTFLFLPPASYGPKPWKESADDDRYRRALYTFRYRSVPYPMLEVFDSPNGDTSCVRRGRSNTPLQALTMLNEPMALESARALAEQALLHGGGTDEQRLTYAFRRCLARKPDASEAADLLAFVHKETGRFSDGELDSWDILGGNPALASLLPANLTPAQLAGWTALSRVLLNLDETITKE
jgi:mono/diheme cytochrome c family protein